MKIWSIVLVGMMGVVTANSGCQRACEPAKAYVSSLDGMAEEANLALDKLERALVLLPVDESDKADVALAMSKARGALGQIRKLLSDSEKLCTSPDAASVFAVFNDAWSILRLFIPLVADSGDGVGVAISPLVKDPSCYQLRRK
jgi:hypothetical protein